MNAAEVKELLRRHYPATQQMGTATVPGAWTCLEEWAGIDLLAIGATSGGGERHAWIGHEVKVSRGDLRAELLNPGKREHYKAHCEQLYLAVPAGLLRPEEIAFDEPAWAYADFEREDCPVCENDRPKGVSRAAQRWPARGSLERVPLPVDLGASEYGTYSWDGWTKIVCRACGGKGHARRSKVEEEWPTLWVPADLGLMTVSAAGVRVVRKAPRREMALPSQATIGQLVRWVSARPDPRHVGLVAEAREHQAELRRRYG